LTCSFQQIKCHSDCIFYHKLQRKRFSEKHNRQSQLKTQNYPPQVKVCLENVTNLKCLVKCDDIVTFGNVFSFLGKETVFSKEMFCLQTTGLWTIDPFFVSFFFKQDFLHGFLGWLDWSIMYDKKIAFKILSSVNLQNLELDLDCGATFKDGATFGEQENFDHLYTACLLPICAILSLFICYCMLFAAEHCGIYKLGSNLSLPE